MRVECGLSGRHRYTRMTSSGAAMTRTRGAVRGTCAYDSGRRRASRVERSPDGGVGITLRQARSTYDETVTEYYNYFRDYDPHVPYID